MKIAINTRFLLDKNLEGFARFTYEISKRLVESHPEDQFYFFFDRKYNPKYIFGTNVKAIVIPPPARHPILWHIWYEYTSKRVLKKIKPDVYLSPDGLTSLGLKIPNITVIHDIGFEKLENQIPKLAEKFWRKRTPKVIKSSTKIITVSEFSKSEILETYNVSKDKIDVVYNGFTSNFKPISKEEKVKIKNKFSDGKEYLLYVGSIHPRKNIQRLIQAFNLYKQKTGSPIKLFLAGRWAWKSEEINETYQNSPYKNDIISTGYISESDLSQLMSGAHGFCYISVYEGFGIPILEAMAAGIPVLTSSISSMPEVAGDAALLANPLDVNDIMKKMEILVEDDSMRKNLVLRGMKRANHFNWEQSAEKVYKIIKELVHH